MPSSDDWRIPPDLQPDPGAFAFDLKEALAAVVGLRAQIPADAFTAETLGTERSGHGVVIRADGLVLTIGYLIAEAQGSGSAPGGPIGAGPRGGVRLRQRLRPRSGPGAPGVPPLGLGDSRRVALGDTVVVGARAA